MVLLIGIAAVAAALVNGADPDDDDDGKQDEEGREVHALGSVRFRLVTGIHNLNGYDCTVLRVTCQVGYSGYAMHAQHTHAADIDATADFLNTLRTDDGRQTDELASADDAIAFLASRGLAHEDGVREQAARSGEAAWLDGVRRARAAVRDLWDAQVERRAPDAGAIDAVNGILRVAPGAQLVAVGDGCTVTHRHADDPTGEALALLAGPLVAAIATGTVERLRVCANDDCRWAFEDRSRAGRRRWCDMSSCGNVAKARRYRARRKEAEGAARATGSAPGA